MHTTLKQMLDLLGQERRGRWLLLVALALMVSGFEMIGAVLVYSLLALVVDPSSNIDLPVIGDLRAQFSGFDGTTLLLSVVGAMALFFLLRGLVRVGATYVQARVAHNAGARLSKRLVDGYLRWPYDLHLRRNSSELVRNGHHAVLEMVDQVTLPVIKVVAESVLVVGMLILLAVIAPAATMLAVVVIGGAAGLLLAVVQPKLRRIGEVNHRESAKTLGSLQQSLHGLRDIKILGREDYFARTYAGSRRRMARARYLRATAAQLPTIVIETALLGFILLFFAAVLLQTGQPQETLSVLGLFAYAGMRLQPSLRAIVNGLNNLKFATASLQDIHADLQTVDATEAKGPQPEPLPYRDVLKFERLSFHYHKTDRLALSEISLEIRPGEQIGICGPTGGGKTTLVDVMTGLLKPTGGRVIVDGQDVHKYPRAWQRNLGIVPQSVFLIDDTLRRNVALGVADDEIDDEALNDALRLAQLDEFVSSLPAGLATEVGERGVRISGGQRQRVAIARALYGRPSVLIFDEGTSALDNATEAELMLAINHLRGRHTIILIAHRLSTVQNCDQIVFLENGLIAGLGRYDDLVSQNAAFRAMAGNP